LDAVKKNKNHAVKKKQKPRLVGLEPTTQLKKTKNTPGGTRTHNRLIRSQTPYPLGHRRFLVFNAIMIN
jgi:hypothetical protein